ncbi:unnamed protein product [Nippostrongylus brasiliensis]|uniref:MTOR-associated protein MEAK7 n=1 Tax=Nippostrongylus brasiliensis TaxID=27835 RepID=A0A0N4YLK7_NIPBR|nr:unnamed protein product [Nippostrongylus brasiliensis]
MGAEASSTAKKPEVVNLNKAQVEKAIEELKKRAKGKEALDRQQFESAFPKLQPMTTSIFEALAEKGQCSFSKILLLADNLLGDSESQACWLLKAFKTSAKALECIVSIYAHRNKLTSDESNQLLDYLLVDLPTDETRFGKWLLGHPVAPQLVLHVFSPLIFENAESFFSELHGSSFSQITKRVNGEGPCLVVITSSSGRQFGCFASAGFSMGPGYHGDATSFLFETQPKLRIYAATGLTENYAYLNCQQVSLPNGLGIGGYESVWPLFIDEDYGKGVTFANVSSFEKCQLSGSNQFEIR